ncbi:MAG: hypothetical protein ACRCXY_11430 [Fusobacteriaceae bacterium]
MQIEMKKRITEHQIIEEFKNDIHIDKRDYLEEVTYPGGRIDYIQYTGYTDK